MKINSAAIWAEDRRVIYRFVVSYISDHVYPPNMKEIASATELSTATVHRHIIAMIEDKILETDEEGDIGRAYRIAGTKVVRTKKVKN